MSLHFGKPVSSLASNSKETVFFFGQTDYKLYLHTVIFYAKYLWSSFPQSRSTEMKKKTSVIFNYRFCVNHYTFSVFQCERLYGITRRPGCEVPGAIASLPSMDLQLLSSNALIRPLLLFVDKAGYNIFRLAFRWQINHEKLGSRSNSIWRYLVYIFRCIYGRC